MSAESRRKAQRKGVSFSDNTEMQNLETQAQRSEGAAQDYFLSVRDENLRPVGLLKDGSKKTKSRALESVGRPSQEQGSDSLSLTMIDEENASLNEGDDASKPLCFAVASNPVSRSFRRRAETFIDDDRVQVVYTVFSLLALFLTDLRIMFLPPSADLLCDLILTIALVLFAIEFVIHSGASRAEKEYNWSMFFWLDLISTLSLIPDIGFMKEKVLVHLIYASGESNLAYARSLCSYHFLNTSIPHGAEGAITAFLATGRITRVGRAARIGRVGSLGLRMLRIMRLLHIFSTYEEKHHVESLQRLPGKQADLVAQLMAKRVMVIVLVVYVLTSLAELLVGGSAPDGGQMGLNLVAVSRGPDGEFSNNTDSGGTSTTASISAMAVAAYLSQLQHAKYPALCLVDLATRMHVTTDEQITAERHALLDTQRMHEVRVVVSAGGTMLTALDVRGYEVRQAFANLVAVVFIIVLLLVCNTQAKNDTRRLVQMPLERIVGAMGSIASKLMNWDEAEGEEQGEALIDINPQLRLGDSRSSSTIQHMEQHHMQALNIDTIEHLMDKVTYLLDIGFGEAGQQIIAACLSGPDGEFNATMPGIHVTAVFGFCDIRRFTDATEVLRADVMPFVNLVADIVHGATVKHNGAPNKNIGDAFLCVWKTEMYAAGTAGPTTADATPVHDTFGETQRIGNARSKKGLNKMEAGSTYSPIPGEGSGRRSRRGSGGATRFRSLEKPIEGSTGSTKRELRRGSVPMIVGLGERSLQEIYSDACDSALKAFVEVITEIDSPKTQQLVLERFPLLRQKFADYKLGLGFGLHHGWAVEGAIGSQHKIDTSYLSPHVNMSARLEAATKQFGIPLLLSGSFVDQLSRTYSEQCRLIDQVKVVGSDKVTRLYTFDIPRIDSAEFYDQFGRGSCYYVGGNWPKALTCLTTCLELVPSDGPTKRLLKTLEKHGNKAPESWDGWRALTEK